jgi:hypothetical protein
MAYATRFDTDDLVFRVTYFAAMLAVAALAVLIPDVAHGSGSAGFALAYVALRSLLLGLYWPAWRPVPEAHLPERWALYLALRGGSRARSAAGSTMLSASQIRIAAAESVLVAVPGPPRCSMLPGSLEGRAVIDAAILAGGRALAQPARRGFPAGALCLTRRGGRIGDLVTDVVAGLAGAVRCDGLGRGGQRGLRPGPALCPARDGGPARRGPAVAAAGRRDQQVQPPRPAVPAAGYGAVPPGHY